MDSMQRRGERQKAQSRREPPKAPRRIDLPFDGAGLRGEFGQGEAIELTIAATDADGEVAEWLHDAWWMESIQLWKNQPLTVRLLPTPGVALNPVVLHQMQMLRRVVPHWHLVVTTSPEDMTDKSALEALKAAPYDEVQLLQESGDPTSGQTGNRRFEGALHRLHPAQSPSQGKPPAVSPGKPGFLPASANTASAQPPFFGAA